nr:hypothetical protein [Pirellulaceae bacterium]
MIPQYDAAAYRQQRWIELENVCSDEIPAYGVCEVTGSYRPETASDQTPGGGRTVLKVQKPTRDNPCAYVLNGPCPIAPGYTGKVGTADYPAYALVESAPNAGEQWGVKAGSFALVKGYCGYVIWGDYDAALGNVRVMHRDDCNQSSLKLVRFRVCFNPGDEEVTGYVVDPCKNEGGTYTETGEEVTVTDCRCWMFVLPNTEAVWVYRAAGGCDDSDDASQVYQPVAPYGLRRRVKIETNIPCAGSGSVTVYKDDDCDLTASECTITVVNGTDRGFAVDVSSEDAIAWSPPGACCWLLENTPRPRLAKADVDAAFCPDDAQTTVTNLEVIDSCNPNWETVTEPTTVLNTGKLPGCKDKKALLAWNEKEGKWTITSVEPVPKDILAAIEENTETCGFNARVLRDVYVHGCSSTSCIEEDVVPLPAGQLDIPYAMSVVGEGEGESYICTFGLATKRVCFLGTIDEESDGTPIELALDRVDPLTAAALGLSESGLCLTPYSTPIYVLGCLGDQAAGTPSCVDIEVCPTTEPPSTEAPS